MKANVGGWDGGLRMVLGLVLIALAATGTVGWWGWLGVIPFAHRAGAFFPLYPLLGLSTCPLQRKR